MENSIQKINHIIQTQGRATAKELKIALGVSQVLIHRHLKTLCETKKIKKIGRAPKVFYIPFMEEQGGAGSVDSEIIEENWLTIHPNGEFLYGRRGFIEWCKSGKADLEKQQGSYESIFAQKEAYKKKGLIEATHKIGGSFSHNYLEKIWYLDFYSWEIFGKTLLGSLILYAKQNSDQSLMRRIAKRIETPLKDLIKRESFDLVGRIPHSVPRKKDFLKTTLEFVNIQPFPETIFEKVFVEHAVAQKTLKSKEARTQNAEETLFLKILRFPQKVLLIDDACGSGATLNIAAKKIKEVSPNTKVYAVTFVGSMNGFEIIAES